MASKKKAAPKGKGKSAADDEDWDSILDAEIKTNATTAPPPAPTEAEVKEKEEDSGSEEEDGAAGAKKDKKKKKKKVKKEDKPEEKKAGPMSAQARAILARRLANEEEDARVKRVTAEHAERQRVEEEREAAEEKIIADEKEKKRKAKEDKVTAQKAAGTYMTKAEKEKAKKAVSKCRNILKKLLRFSAAMGGDKGEYGVLTVDEVEAICASCSQEELNKMNDAMGGEAASKDQALVQAGGFAWAKVMAEAVNARSGQAEEDEQIAKDAKKREAEDKMLAEKNRGKKAAEEEKEWTAEQLAALQKCLGRYPAGSAGRWVSITNYINVKTSPEKSYSQEEVVIAAYKLSC
mmetsp:Transcript_22116/g.49169  ORF Transcript_22116/g.49169 Transcript_22116/m.49169 type:complete len:349 (+) Transcript_22116:93-1139(+)